MLQSKSEDRAIRFLLILSHAEESRRLRERWAVREPDFQLAIVPSTTEALAYLANQRADAVVCDWVVLAKEAGGALLNAGAVPHPVPIVVLLPAGMEEPVAPLVAQGLFECVVKTGNYDLLLAAKLRRLVQLHRRGIESASMGLPRSESSEADFEAVGRILRHEINNPLTGILGNSELILESRAQLPSEVRQRVETIISLAVRLRDLIRNLEQVVNNLTDSSPALPAPVSRELERPQRPAGESTRLR